MYVIFDAELAARRVIYRYKSRTSDHADQSFISYIAYNAHTRCNSKHNYLPLAKSKTGKLPVLEPSSDSKTRIGLACLRRDILSH